MVTCDVAAVPVNLDHSIGVMPALGRCINSLLSASRRRKVAATSPAMTMLGLGSI
jgi:hypothetical protein